MQIRLVLREKGQLKMKQLPASEWRHLGEVMLKANKKRMLQGLNVQGVPAKPLSVGYAKRKAKKRRTLKVVRDMYLSGETMLSFKVTRAAGGKIKAEPTTAVGRRRAWGAQLRGKEQMIGFSPVEEQAVVNAVKRLYGRGTALVWEQK